MFHSPQKISENSNRHFLGDDVNVNKRHSFGHFYDYPLPRSRELNQGALGARQFCCFLRNSPSSAASRVVASAENSLL